jgi:uncharacterized protein (TIGR02444 family)
MPDVALGSAAVDASRRLGDTPVSFHEPWPGAAGQDQEEGDETHRIARGTSALRDWSPRLVWGRGMTQFPECRLWDFSVAVYGREGVAAACLSLQDRHRADVNLLLYCCWLGADGCRALDADALARAAAGVERWHWEVVCALRAVRKRLKENPEPASGGHAAGLRRRIGAVELEAEHIEQILLGGLPLPPMRENATQAQRISCASDNARRYLANLGARLDDRDIRDLEAVLSGCLPELDRAPAASLAPKS